MKQVGLVCALCAMALIVGCGKQKETVVRITDLPTIDTTAVDQYVTLDEPSIASGGLFVQIKGTAKVDLGQGMQVTVTRFKDGQRLDTKPAVIRLNKPPDPSEMPPDRTPGAEGLPPDMEAHEPPPPPPPIVAGDPVQVLIDASCEGGIITKLVIAGSPSGGGMMPPGR